MLGALILLPALACFLLPERLFRQHTKGVGAGPSLAPKQDVYDRIVPEVQTLP
jgi:hypothetical protein